jgi:HlyD family secretion protein
MKIRDLLLPLLALGSIVYATTSIVRTQPVRELTEPPNAPPRSSFANSIAAVGLVEPSSEAISIGSARSGVVDQVFVTVGDQVKKDQPLLKLRTSELEAERDAAQAAIGQAEAQAEVALSQVSVAEAQVKIASAELANAQRLLDFAESVKDNRVISDEERTQRKMTVLTQQAKHQSAEASVASAKSSVASAKAAVTAAKAQLQVIQVEIDRSTIKAPLDATVLQLRIRAGEYASSATSPTAWLTLGQTQDLHLRADVDEHEAWRVKEGAKAQAQVRGNPSQTVDLSFVRYEPLVIPKRSLTGDATERVDTRVLQVIYKIQSTKSLRLFPGQQMDVFIEAPETLAAQ